MQYKTNNNSYKMWTWEVQTEDRFVLNPFILISSPSQGVWLIPCRLLFKKNARLVYKLYGHAMVMKTWDEHSERSTRFITLGNR